MDEIKNVRFEDNRMLYTRIRPPVTTEEVANIDALDRQIESMTRTRDTQYENISHQIANLQRTRDALAPVYEEAISRSSVK